MGRQQHLVLVLVVAAWVCGAASAFSTQGRHGGNVRQDGTENDWHVSLKVFQLPVLDGVETIDPFSR
jgi:hypothetical protein